MRGSDEQTTHLFSYLSPEFRVRADHPLRQIRTLTDAALREIAPAWEALYAPTGRPSIPPEQLLRALVLQVLYSVRSERLLMEELDYSILYRWFVGLGLDEPIWDHSTVSRNRDRWQVSTAGGISPRWRPDGNELYHVAPDSTLMAVPIASTGAGPELGRPAALFKPRIYLGGDGGGTFRQQYDVGPDGRFLINVTTDDGSTSSPITVIQNWQGGLSARQE